MPLGPSSPNTPRVPTIDDLSVYRHDEELLVVTSWLTRGRCAEVWRFSFSERYTIRPFLMPNDMQGISYSLIRMAVEKFVAEEASRKAGQSGAMNADAA
jgi:hypothetical protein